MKITKIDILPIRHYLFVQMHTDAGITGLGEAGNWGFLNATKETIRKFSEYLIGKDPFQIEHHYQDMYRAMYFRGSVIMSAISALEIAMWDIKGKALGVPIYELLGGRTRDRVRVYASNIRRDKRDADSIAEALKDLKNMGYTAGKIMLADPVVQPDGKNEFYSNKVSLAAEKVIKAREAVGEDFDLILEVHRSMNVPEAIAFGKEVESCRPMVLEDPIPPDDVDAMAYVAGKVNIPIATGERFCDYHEFKTLLARGGAQYVRPDVCAVGGIGISKKVTALAEAFSAMIIPHNPLGPVSTAACIQLCACSTNVGIMELPATMLNKSEDSMLVKPMEIKDGCLMIPDDPGLGIELAENAGELFPEKDRAEAQAHLNFDGSVRDF